jgi:hypothetical protein
MLQLLVFDIVAAALFQLGRFFPSAPTITRRRLPLGGETSPEPWGRVWSTQVGVHGVLRGATRGRIVLPGSFNPIHEGHSELLQVHRTSSLVHSPPASQPELTHCLCLALPC